MHLTHMVVDDFFPDPDVVRAAALKQDYPPAPEGALYPGRNSAKRIRIDGLEAQVGALLQTRLSGVAVPAHSRFRLCLEGEKGKASKHVDPAHWSAIIYLSRDEDCRGGTEFFRHKRTGLDRAPVFEEDLAALGYESPTEMWQDVFWPDTNNPDAWEPQFEIPMAYNRMALFRSYLWHDAGPGFGTDPETGRLIMVLALKEEGLPDPYGEPTSE